MKTIYKYQAELITLFVIIFSLFFIAPRKKYKKPINGDLKGYYAYLPAIFIYNDLQYNFVERVEEKYYPLTHFKEFRTEFKGKKVNKTFVGLSILIAPFFLLAHGLSVLFGFDLDGYSLLYQWSVIIAVWFYLWMSIRLLIRILKYFGATNKQSLLINTLLIFGTNIIYYTAFDFTVSHIYSLFLLNALIYSCIKFKETVFGKYIIITSLIFGLLVIIRPTNLLSGLLIFTVFNTKDDFKYLKERLLSGRKLLLIAGSLCFVFIIPVLFWYLQTGYYFVYSYGEEGFNFAKPEMLNILFSYKKGWFLYNPILIFALAGLILSFKSKFESKLALAFILLMVYVYSCWWIWTFGGGFGQRVFIEYSFLYAFGGLWFIKLISRFKWNKLILVPIILLVSLNLVQAIQTYKGILPGGKVTSEIYWDNFLSLKKKARYYLGEDYQSEIQYSTDLESNKEWNNELAKTNKLAKSGQFSFEINNKAHYSPSKKFQFNFNEQKEYHFILTAEVNAISKLEKAAFVIDVKNEVGEQFYKLFPVKMYVEQNNWVKMQFGTELPKNFKGNSEVKFYVWNPKGKEHFFVDDLDIEIKSKFIQ